MLVTIIREEGTRKERRCGAHYWFVTENFERPMRLQDGEVMP